MTGQRSDTVRIEPVAAWSIADWMAATGKSRSTVLKMIANGEIPARQSKAGGHWYTPGLQAEAWLKGEWQPKPSAVPLSLEDFLKHPRRETA